MSIGHQLGAVLVLMFGGGALVLLIVALWPSRLPDPQVGEPGARLDSAKHGARPEIDRDPAA